MNYIFKLTELEQKKAKELWGDDVVIEYYDYVGPKKTKVRIKGRGDYVITTDWGDTITVRKID
jgi:hypothetical protein